MTIEEFKENFAIIRSKGFIKSKRNGPTGIGHTLESELGLLENNHARPDLEGAELKARRIGSNNMISLFTFNKKAWKMKQLDAIRKYGSLDRDGRIGLYYTMALKPNSAGLFLNIVEHEISVQHTSGEIIATWQLEIIAERLTSKLPSLILVSAFTESHDGIEYFHYDRAQLLSGSSPNLIANQFKEGNILVDLRLHDKGTSARNHGTGFRAYESNLTKLFSNCIDL
jgi:hypothetical protein